MKINKQIEFEDDYSVEVNLFEKNKWYEIISQFSDVNIYQTWSFDLINSNRNKVNHFILKKNNTIVAAAQIRIMTIPIFGLGIAYIRWGPLFKLKNRPVNPNFFRLAVRALKNEYVYSRKFILRLFPNILNDGSESYLEILKDEGYYQVKEKNKSRTLILDISPSMNDLRKNLNQKWRNCLNKAEKNNLKIVEGSDSSIFSNFISLYRELLKRKKFEEPNDINQFRLLQKDLPIGYKMKIFICRVNEVNVAGGIFSFIGDTGLYLFGATNELGMKTNGSYLIQWAAIKHMKEIGCHYYNLNGINPNQNPGGYHFKVGISGKSGLDAYYLGRFQTYSGLINSVLIKILENYLPIIKRLTKNNIQHLFKK
jgi:lipid II:glycine glycyltransferase (peptidoglycan interpeptide bridge formation enzyme)